LLVELFELYDDARTCERQMFLSCYELNGKGWFILTFWSHGV